jgi:hypothetical protein
MFFTVSCSDIDSRNKKINFYYWKTNASLNDVYKKTIESLHTQKIYLHYFDVEKKGISNRIIPTYVLKKVSKSFKKFEIVPVIYITNAVFKSTSFSSEKLSNRIEKLINQISQKHFNKKIKTIQIDCDWSQTTKNAYFDLLEKMKANFDINVTIRLHQIKFQNKTGIPPVKNGTLMLYNMGDLKNRKQNSIIQSNIVKQYVNDQTKYPLNLNLGLPLFSQTIVFNEQDKIKIIKNTEPNILEKDQHFKKIDTINFEVVQDTLYKGFFLSKGYNLKLEKYNQDEIINSYNIIKKSQLQIDEIIFYHLDEKILQNVDIDDLTEKL